ncbi:hypothetical protein LOK49_LG15G02029 [Camellia lanceoleosa]|uniref:Uncharacterized protein n=1 Tax=Camellia lanceoleosa TaxID=1840588 RepID=A0ACC0F6W7_9ERIC|nr:hypothetical protein LOK49_LG15G02029 [Camellia lanceoleosa]
MFTNNSTNTNIELHENGREKGKHSDVAIHGTRSLNTLLSLSSPNRAKRLQCNLCEHPTQHHQTPAISPTHLFHPPPSNPLQQLRPRPPSRGREHRRPAPNLILTSSKPPVSLKPLRQLISDLTTKQAALPHSASSPTYSSVVD